MKEQGESFVGGVVYVASSAPLDRRYSVWQDFGKMYNLTEKAVWGVVNDTVPASVADQTKAVLRANPDITAVFTPWDEFAKGVKLAVDELGVSDKVKIYWIDISTPDIELIRKDKSAWVATAATNAAVVGEVAVRALALDIAGQFPGRSVLLKPTLVIRNGPSRADAVTLLGPVLPPDTMASALACAAAVREKSSRGRALGALLPHLPAAMTPRALELAQAACPVSLGAEKHAECLGSLVELVPPTLRARAARRSRQPGQSGTADRV